MALPLSEYPATGTRRERPTMAYFRESLDLVASLDDASLQALALAGLARVALYTDPPEAVRLLREALDLARDLPDNDPGRSSAVHVLGPALQMSGDLEGAREVIGQRLATAERQGVAFVVWSESANLSMVERRLGNLDRAEELSRQAVDTETAREHDLYLGWTLNGLAAVAAAKGQSVRAATVLGAAASLLQRAGGEWPPDELEQFKETDAALGRALPPDELEHARAQGAAMSREQPVAYALS
jgi:tetratricopeptide (TPR) repeat protein